MNGPTPSSPSAPVVLPQEQPPTADAVTVVINSEPQLPTSADAQPPILSSAPPLPTAGRPRSASDSVLQRRSQAASSSSPPPAAAPALVSASRPLVLRYVSKFRGQRQPLHAQLPWPDMLLAFAGSFFGILLPAVLTFNLLEQRLGRGDLTLIIGSFGASAVLLYSAVVSDFAQPRSVLGGHIVSAFIGVSVRKMFPIGDVSVDFLACALAVSVAIAAMNLTRTLHPPGGATALIAVLPNEQIQSLGFLYIVIPVAAGVALMLLVALVVNNIPRNRVWPKLWL